MKKNINVKEIEINRGQIYGLPKNPRLIRDERFEALKKSIQDAPEMLDLRELIVYPHEGKYVIIGGNMRFRACQDLGYTEIPCKVLPEETPVAKLREYTIKDNEAFGQNDWGLLSEDWDKEELVDWGVELTDDWNAGGKDEDKKVTVEDDDFDEENNDIPKRCELGDVWQLGDHRLICGDSTDAAIVKKLLGSERADLYLTDPPYNVNYTGCTKDALTIKNDNMEDKDFRNFLILAFSSANEVMKNGAAFYIWHAGIEGFNFQGACRDVEWKVRECLIWNKNEMIIGRQDYQWKHEPCLYGWKGGASHKWYSDRSQTTVLDFPKPTRAEKHPTMKPIPLFAYLVQNSTKEGDIVLDSFGGSGTTMMACEQLKRKSRLIELDPHYCNVIIARWEKFTGGKAEKL